MHKDYRKPSLLLGDFNSVLHNKDRIGANPMTCIEVTNFANCIEDYRLIEIPYQGSKYAWNDKNIDTKIFSKIDWIFIN